MYKDPLKASRPFFLGISITLTFILSEITQIIASKSCLVANQKKEILAYFNMNYTQEDLYAILLK